MKIKSFLKNNKKCIFAFIAGGILFSTISVSAAILLSADEVKLDIKETSKTDVKGALDELYTMYKFGNASSSNILSGATALVGGKQVTGEMANNKSWTSSPNSSTKVTIPKGYHDGTGFVDTAGVYTAGVNSGKSSITSGTQTKLTQGTWTNNKLTVTASAGYNGSELTSTVDASSIYNAGVTAGKNSVPASNMELVWNDQAHNGDKHILSNIAQYYDTLEITCYGYSATSISFSADTIDLFDTIHNTTDTQYGKIGNSYFIHHKFKNIPNGTTITANFTYNKSDAGYSGICSAYGVRTN